MGKLKTKIGDVFSAQIDTKTKKYFQYVANDLTQLNSDVIRVFKTAYPIDIEPILSDIVKDEIDFYAHCITDFGLKLGLWKKEGNYKEIGKLDVIFKTSGDRGNPDVKISNDWYVWRVNDKSLTRVGKLQGENRKAEVGSVVPPDSIIYRMLHGEYDFVYPTFE